MQFIILVTLTLLHVVNSVPGVPITALADNKGTPVWSSFGSVARWLITVYEARQVNDKWKLLGHHGQRNWDKLEKEVHSFRDNTANKTAFATPTTFTQIWNCKGDSTWVKGSFWRMTCPKGYVSLGDAVFASNSLKSPPAALYERFRCVRSDLTEKCRGWGYKIWDNGNSIAKKSASVWPPTPETTAWSEFFFTHTELESWPKVQPYCLKKTSFDVL